MHQSVRDAFPSFSKQFEGRVPWMYLDVKGLVTIGVGNLIDPLYLALNLTFVLANGDVATAQQIKDEWNLIKGHPELAEQGHLAAKKYTKLRLTDASITNLVRYRLDQNELFLRQQFKGWSEYPADAQLAIHSMAWAMGAGFYKKFPVFCSHIIRNGSPINWEGAAKTCLMRTTNNPGLIPRNKANVKAFLVAADVQREGSDISILRSYVP